LSIDHDASDESRILDFHERIAIKQHEVSDFTRLHCSE
jgi:hypothetical protein